MAVVADSDEQLERGRDAMRPRLAFYGSTPAYKVILDVHGWGDLQPELTRMSKEGKWRPVRYGEVQLGQTGGGAGMIGGLTITPGLYKWTSSVTVPSNVTIAGAANDIFIFQIALYSFHEFAEAGVFGARSDSWHAATEVWSPEGLYGKWISLAIVAVSSFWLLVALVGDRLRRLEPMATPVPK